MAELKPGLYEALLTGALDRKLADLLITPVAPELRDLADAEAADRLSRHFSAIVTRAIEALPERGRRPTILRILASSSVRLRCNSRRGGSMRRPKA